MVAVARPVSRASSLTSAATTAKPLPASPARAASIVALRASRLVCSAMLVIIPRTWEISDDPSARLAAMASVRWAWSAASDPRAAAEVAWWAISATAWSISLADAARIPTVWEMVAADADARWACVAVSVAPPVSRELARSSWPDASVNPVAPVDTARTATSMRPRARLTAAARPPSSSRVLPSMRTVRSPSATWPSTWPAWRRRDRMVRVTRPATATATPRARIERRMTRVRVEPADDAASDSPRATPADRSATSASSGLVTDEKLRAATPVLAAATARGVPERKSALIWADWAA